MKYVLNLVFFVASMFLPTASAVSQYDFGEVDKKVDGFISDPSMNLFNMRRVTLYDAELSNNDDPATPRNWPKISGITLAVARRGEGVVYLRGYDGFKPERVSLIASVSKIVTAMVILRLVDKRILELDRPVIEYTDESFQSDLEFGKDHKNFKVEMKHLLSMTSGLQGDQPFGGWKREAECREKSANPTEEPDALRKCGLGILQDPNKAPQPGDIFVYGASQWTLAGAISEMADERFGNVSTPERPGRTWESIFQEELKSPCALDNTFYTNYGICPKGVAQCPYPYEELNDEPENFGGLDWIKRTTGIEVSGIPQSSNPRLDTQVSSTIEDLGKLLLMMLNGGICEGERVLSPTRVAQMISDQVPLGSDETLDSWQQLRIDKLLDRHAKNDPSHPLRSWKVKNYGFGFFRYEYEKDLAVYVVPGGAGSRFFLVPAEGWGATFIMEASSEQADLLFAEIFPALREAVLNGSEHFNIPAAGFSPVKHPGGRLQGSYNKFDSGWGSGAAAFHYSAAVNLPGGAKVHRMRVWLREAGYYPTHIDFGTWPLEGDPNHLVSIAGIDSPFTKQKSQNAIERILSTEVEEVIDNSTNMYGVKVILRPDNSLTGVQLTYSDPEICDTETQPAPHWGVKQGRCLASCGALAAMGGFMDRVSWSDEPCSKHLHLDVGPAYDVPYCCMWVKPKILFPALTN